ncbi:arylsulfotransferase [Kipferlia bialata]|uniref:non-specific serine/threonine protein kinase n=1 Tax=Kipferlia bialata TaxID=797122 RepID=A0A9K3CWU2_9EUKA|nr:arylsulfotransferase [Kipferlia bialata]|eukprot:g5170.t1
MDYANGGDFSNLLSMVGAFPEDAARLYFAEMVESVSLLHDSGFVHRDIKPSNFLVAKSGHLLLADFGLAKLVQTAEEKARDTSVSSDRALESSSSGGMVNSYLAYSVVGTPAYMAPEVVSGEGYGRGVDFWSLGCILFEMVAGYAPFCGTSPQHIFEIVTELGYRPPERPEGLFTNECWDLLCQLLSSPSDRLGAGKPGEPNSLESLRTHSYFTGMPLPESSAYSPTGQGYEDGMDLVIDPISWGRPLFDVRPYFVPQLENDLDTTYFPPCALDRLELSMSDAQTTSCGPTPMVSDAHAGERMHRQMSRKVDPMYYPGLSGWFDAAKILEYPLAEDMWDQVPQHQTDFILAFNRHTKEPKWIWRSYDNIKKDLSDLPYVSVNFNKSLLSDAPIYGSDIAFDTFHCNSFSPMPDGGILLSVRAQDAVYKVDVGLHGDGTGDVHFDLAEFTLVDGEGEAVEREFPWLWSHQHNPIATGIAGHPDLYAMSVFSNNNGERYLPERNHDAHSRGQLYLVNEARQEIYQVFDYELPVFCPYLGSSAVLDTGVYFSCGLSDPLFGDNMMVTGGTYAVELEMSGALRTAWEAKGIQSYRTYRMAGLFAGSDLRPSTIADQYVTVMPETWL